MLLGNKTIVNISTLIFIIISLVLFTECTKHDEFADERLYTISFVLDGEKITIKDRSIFTYKNNNFIGYGFWHADDDHYVKMKLRRNTKTGTFTHKDMYFSYKTGNGDYYCSKYPVLRDFTLNLNKWDRVDGVATGTFHGIVSTWDERYYNVVHHIKDGVFEADIMDWEDIFD